MKTKEAIKTDYKELMDKLGSRIDEIRSEANEMGKEMNQSLSEKMEHLQSYRQKLKAKLSELETTTDESFSQIADSVESTYNKALEDLSAWLKEKKTRN